MDLLQCVSWSLHTEDPADGRLHHAASPLDLKPHHHRGLSSGPGWALVGDAGYHRDPITGHGISDAFRDADLVAEAVHGWFSGVISEREAMRRYDGARTLAIREIFAITCELTTFPGVPRFAALQRRLSQAIEREALELADRPALSSEPVLAA